MSLEDAVNDISLPGSDNTINKEVVDGEEHVISSTTSVTDDKGVVTETIKTYKTIAADGRKFSEDQYVAKSWKKEKIPADKYDVCKDPFGSHDVPGERAVYMGIDGYKTDKGTTLCLYCHSINDSLKKLRMLSLGFLVSKDQIQ